MLVSCNNQKETQRLSEEAAYEELVSVMHDSSEFTTHYQVDIIGRVNKNDNFQLFYSEDYLLSFSSLNKITTQVQGSAEYQTIRFDLGEGVFPDRFRFDLGSNRGQMKISIDAICVRFENKEILVPKHLLNKYFISNEYIQIVNGEYHLSVIEIDGLSTYDPFLLCSPEFVRLLLRL